MNTKSNLERYAGVNALASAVNAASNRRTARAMEDVSEALREKNDILIKSEQRARADARKAIEVARAQTEAIKQGNAEKARELRRQALIQKEAADREFKAAQKERDLQARARDEENLKREKKGLLFAMYDDHKKMMSDKSLSNLDKYIHLCSSVSLIGRNELSQMITDDLSEKTVVQNMIDKIESELESARNNFTKQDQQDHDQLLEILENDEESIIAKLEEDIAEQSLKNLQRKTSLEKNLFPINKEISEYQKKIEIYEGEISKFEKNRNSLLEKKSLIDIFNYFGKSQELLDKDLESKENNSTPSVSEKTLNQMVAFLSDSKDNQTKKISPVETTVLRKSKNAKSLDAIKAFHKKHQPKADVLKSTTNSLLGVLSWPFRLIGKIVAWMHIGWANPNKRGFYGPKTGRWIENPNYGKSREWILARYKRIWTIFFIIMFLLFLFSG